MDDIIFWMAFSSSVLTIIFLISLLRKRGSSDESQEQSSQPQAASNIAARMERGSAVRRVGGSRVARRSRLTPSAQPQPSSTFDQFDDNFDNAVIDEDLEDGDDDEGDTNKPFASDQKIGAKKRKKLEMKAEKKAQREQEINEREERLKRKALLEEKRKQEEETEATEQARKLEEEKRLQKLKEEKEHEEYLKLIATFEIESSGFEEQAADSESGMLQDFIQHIIKEKVVLLEDIAVLFKLKTQDVIDRINSLLESKELTGVIDDRGKFIYISREELLAISKFIHQRGRVTISELAENSNSLIMMGHNQKDVKVNS